MKHDTITRIPSKLMNDKSELCYALTSYLQLLAKGMSISNIIDASINDLPATAPNKNFDSVIESLCESGCEASDVLTEFAYNNITKVKMYGPCNINILIKRLYKDIGKYLNMAKKINNKKIGTDEILNASMKLSISIRKNIIKMNKYNSKHNRYSMIEFVNADDVVKLIESLRRFKTTRDAEIELSSSERFLFNVDWSAIKHVLSEIIVSLY